MRAISQFLSTKAMRKKSFFSMNKSQLVLLGLVACSAFGAARAEATNYYVSPAGNNSDGTSYANAWTTFSKVNWSKFNNGDTLIIDGGSQGAVYNQSLTIKAPGKTVTVMGATEINHNGQVILDGQNTLPVGIDIVTPCKLGGGGSSATGILVRNFVNYDLKLEIGAVSTMVRNLELTASKYGAYIVQGQNSSGSASPPSLNFLTVHDNSVAGILADSQCQLNQSWIYNTAYPAAGTTNIGASLNNQTNSPSQNAAVYMCVFGPGLSYGLASGTKATALGVAGCLFIDAANANVLIQQPAQQGGQFVFNGCTSFSTAKNANEQGHYNFANLL